MQTYWLEKGPHERGDDLFFDDDDDEDNGKRTLQTDNFSRVDVDTSFDIVKWFYIQLNWTKEFQIPHDKISHTTNNKHRIFYGISTVSCLKNEKKYRLDTLIGPGLYQYK